MTGLLLLGAAPLTSALNNQRLVINVPTGNIWTNIAKGFTWGGSWGEGPDPSNSTADGYPVSTPSSNWGCNPAMPQGYYGNLVLKWTGTASYQIIGDNIIVSSCPASTFAELGVATSGSIIGNATISGVTLNQTTNKVIYQHGWKIDSVSNNGSGLVRITVGGNNYSALNSTSISITGATGVVDGVYVMTYISSTQFDLNASFTITGGAAGTAVYAAPSLSILFPNFGTYSGFSNFVICKQADETAVAGGQMTDPVLINQFKDLMNNASRGNPGYLRFMDRIGVQGSYESDFSKRWPTTFLYYPGAGSGATRFLSDYYVGTITNTTDALACSDPATSVWSGSAYIDNAVVQGSVTATNAGGNPTLNVGGHGAKPIYDAYIHPLFIGLTGTPVSGGLTMTWTFSAGGASWLNGGSSYTLTYTTSAGATFNVALAGTNQIAVSSISGALAVGQVINSNFVQNPMVITSIGSTGGGSGTYTVNSTSNLGATPVAAAVLTDVGNLGNLSYHLQQVIDGDSVLSAATIQCANPGFGVNVYCPTAQAGRLTITYVSGPAICSIYLLAANSITTGNNTFVYNYLVDGWIYFPGQGLLQSIPIEAIVEMCNQSNSHCWYCWGTTRVSYVTAVTDHMAINLNAGLKFSTETGNEVWNAQASPFSQWSTLGAALGWNYASGGPNLSYTGLRTIQFAALSRAAWASAGRAASDHLILSMSQNSETTLGNNTPIFQFAGTNLNASTFPFYASYGQLNGTGTAIPTGASGYSVAPNRPIDISNAIGFAPYWGSQWLGGDYTSVQGTVVQNAPLLQASLDYANGSHSTAFSSLVSQFNGGTSRTDGYSAAQVLDSSNPIGNGNYDEIFTSFESIAAHYDNSVSTNLRYNGLPNLGIFHYEGGPQWGSGANYVGGVNSVNVQDVQALAAQFGSSSCSWGSNAAAYTQSGAPLSITSGTYNNSTGTVTLTLSGSNPFISGVAFSSARLYLSGGSMVVDASGGTITGIVNAGMTVTGVSVPANTTIIGPHPTTAHAWYITGGTVTVGPEAMTVGDTVTVSSLTGTGTNLASLDGTFQTIVTTSGATLTYQASAGLGSITITGGTVFDANATFTEIATNIFTMTQAWKADVSYKNFIKTSYYQMLASISGVNREVHPAQYGYYANNWGLFPVSYTLTGTQYTNYDAIHEWDA